MSKDEFIDFVYTMHLQNTNGRESHDEMFKLGIGAAYDEMMEFISINDYLPEHNKYVLVKTPFCKYPAAVAYWNGVDYDKLVKINKLLRELLRENEKDLKNIESAQGVWHSSKDGGSYCP